MSNKKYFYFFASFFLILGLFFLTRAVGDKLKKIRWFKRINQGHIASVNTTNKIVKLRKEFIVKQEIDLFNEKLIQEPWLISYFDWSDVREKVKIFPDYNKNITYIVRKNFYKGLREVLEKAKKLYVSKIDFLMHNDIASQEIKTLQERVKKINNRLYNLLESGY